MGRVPEKKLLPRRHANGQQIYEKVLNLTIREMRIKTTMRYQLILVRMAVVNKTSNNKC